MRHAFLLRAVGLHEFRPHEDLRTPDPGFVLVHDTRHFKVPIIRTWPCDPCKIGALKPELSRHCCQAVKIVTKNVPEAVGSKGCPEVNWELDLTRVVTQRLLAFWGDAFEAHGKLWRPWHAEEALPASQLSSSESFFLC
jgi:hypothetical protein